MKQNKKAAPNETPFSPFADDEFLLALVQYVGPGDWLYSALLLRAMRDKQKDSHHASRSHKRLLTEATGTDYANAWKSTAR